MGILEDIFGMSQGPDPMQKRRLFGALNRVEAGGDTPNDIVRRAMGVELPQQNMAPMPAPMPAPMAPMNLGGQRPEPQRAPMPQQPQTQDGANTPTFSQPRSFRQGLRDFGMALQGGDVPDREAEAETKNQTFQFLMRKGMPEADARAVVQNPALMKELLPTLIASKQQKVGPGEVVIDTQGNTVFDNSEKTKPTNDITNFNMAKENGFTGSFMDFLKTNSGQQRESLSDKAVERSALADQLGLKGPQKTHYVATGDLPRDTQPQEMKEYQTKDAMWADRLFRAEKAIDTVAGIDATGAPAKRTVNGKTVDAYNPARNANAWWPDSLPGANLANSTEWQQYQQAAREGIAAILRKDTGAAVTRDEWDLYFPMLYPQPGDGPEVVKNKKKSREEYAKALRASSGGAFDKMFPQYGGEQSAAPGPASAPTRAKNANGDVIEFRSGQWVPAQ